MNAIDLVGFAGAAVVLGAFALSNARSARVTPKTLAVMNLGAGALALNGLVHHAWPSTVVNTIWFGIAVVALGREKFRWRGSASRVSSVRRPDPGAALVELEHDSGRGDDSRIVRGGQDGASRSHLLRQHSDDPIDRRLILL